MVEIDAVDEEGAEGQIPRAEVVASTLEALQARVDEDGRQALRGAIVLDPPHSPPPDSQV